MSCTKSIPDTSYDTTGLYPYPYHFRIRLLFPTLQENSCRVVGSTTDQTSLSLSVEKEVRSRYRKVPVKSPFYWMSY